MCANNMCFQTVTFRAFDFRGVRVIVPLFSIKIKLKGANYCSIHVHV